MVQPESEPGEVRCCHCGKFFLRWLCGSAEITCPRCKILARYTSDGESVHWVVLDDSQAA